jgi:putative RNA 2'-phosphotransferase
MSLILRHEPERFGISLDPEGFTPLADLLAAVRTRRTQTRHEDIVRVVREVEPEKQRFSIVDDEIRANYGHSLDRRITHEAAAPPAVLFHGTHRQAMDAILVDGLRPMKRQYVHLTVDPALARTVGARRGAPVILRVEAARAAAGGLSFYRANARFWLADVVPASYLSVVVDTLKAGGGDVTGS